MWRKQQEAGEGGEGEREKKRTQNEMPKANDWFGVER